MVGLKSSKNRNGLIVGNGLIVVIVGNGLIVGLIVGGFLFLWKEILL